MGKETDKCGMAGKSKKKPALGEEKAYLGKEKGIFGSYICPLKRKRAKFSCILTNYGHLWDYLMKLTAELKEK